jgi:hypothetical protein
MNYFIIDNSINKKIVGKYPQAVDAEYSCDVWDDPRFIDDAAVSFKKVDFEPITAKAIMAKKAKLTDYMHIGVNGFTRKPIVSGKLKSILEITGNEGLQFHHSPVIYQGKEVEDYWVLNPFLFNMQSINFKRANVYLMESMFNIVERLNINTYEDYLKQKAIVEEKGFPFSIRIKDFQISEENVIDFLVIENVKGGINYLVSEKLKQHLEAESITGIEYQPLNLSSNEWLGPGGERERLYGKS